MEPAFGSGVLLPLVQVLGGRAFYAQGAIAVVPFGSVETTAEPVDCADAGGVVTSRGTCCQPDFNAEDSASAEAAVVEQINDVVARPRRRARVAGQQLETGRNPETGGRGDNVDHPLATTEIEVVVVIDALVGG